MEEPCVMCGRDTEMVCSRCNDRRYCSGECQKEDWLEHKTDCGGVDAFFGIGKWKGVISEHARLLMDLTEQIASGGNRTLQKDRLAANRARWQKGGRVDTKALQDLGEKFNNSLETYAEVLKQTRGGEKLRVSIIPVQSSAADLATFFRERRRFGTVLASPRDYGLAFDKYSICLTNHAVYASLYGENNDPEDMKRRDDRRRICQRVAKALGAVLNGSAWKNPIK